MRIKKHVAGYAATAIVAIAIGAASSGDTSTVTATPLPAVTVTVPGPAVTVTAPPKTVRVTSTPKECLTALDLARDFANAVAVEHTIMGEASTQAGTDGDMIAMFTTMTDAITEMGQTTKSITPKMSRAATTCRAS